MVAREELLAAVSAEENDLFVALIAKHNASKDPFDVNEAVACLARKQISMIWEKLQMKCTSMLLSFDVEDEDEAKKLEDATVVLQGIVTVAIATVQVEDVFIPVELRETAVILHGIVLSLPECCEKLAGSIVQLCEMWWNKRLDGYTDLILQPLVYLLGKSLQVKATQSTVKRIWAMHQSLTLVDIDGDSCKILRSRLLLAVTSTNFLKCDEGRKFLAFLFRIKLSFIDDLHKAIKNYLPVCPRSMVEWYGEIYFHAWRGSSGEFRERIETGCIQDLMFHAIHAPRGMMRSMSSILRQVLGYIHKQKKHRDTDKMLLRLYEPILWRSLKVANGQVRANAASLLVDAFPLQDPEANIEEHDTLMQKQIDILQTMLYDSCPMVRSIVVLGVCHIANVYWEMLPTATLSWFIRHLIDELAWDAASAEVRAAVLKGISHVLDNRLCHPMMKLLLPKLSNLLHDTSESVRVAFLDLLLKVKGLRSVKFWTIASMEHLLSRLEIDSGAVVRRLMKLVSNSFLPLDKPPDEQVTRCITLLEKNPGAARNFYRYVHEKMPVSNTVKFMATLCRCVLECVRKEARKKNRNDGEEEDGEVEKGEDDEEKENEDDMELSMTDTELMAGFLEVILILWEGINPKLKKPENSELKQKLQQGFSQALPELFQAFTDPRICSCLTLLAGFVPPNTIPTFSRSTLSKLRKMEAESNDDNYGTLLQSMCKWGRGDSVLELISDWLEPVIAKPDEQTPANKSQRRSRGVKFTEPESPRPEMALVYLRFLIRNAVCRQILLDTVHGPLRDITTTLCKIIPRIDERLRSTDALSELVTDDFLVQAFEVYCKLEVLLHNAENRDHNAVTVLEQLLTWADTELLMVLRQKKVAKRRLLNETEMTLLAGPDSDNTLLSATALNTTMSNMTLSTTIGGSKRTAGNMQSAALVTMATKLLETLMTVVSNTLLVGVADQEMLSHVADFIKTMLKSDDVVRFLEQVLSILYQATELWLSWETEEGDEGVGSHGDVIPELITAVVQVLARLVKNKQEEAERLLPIVQPVMAEILQTYCRHNALNSTINKTVMATIMAATLAEMTHTVKTDAGFERCDKIADLPLLTAFLISAVGRRKQTFRVFLQELTDCVESGAVTELEGFSAILHIIHTAAQSGKFSDIKDCLMIVQRNLDGFRLPENTPEDAPVRHLLTSSRQMSKDCMNKFVITS